MSNIKKVQIGEIVYDIDAKTVDGHSVEQTGIASNTTTIPTTAQVKAYVDEHSGSGVTYIDEEITLTQFETMLDETSISQFSQSFQDVLKNYDSNTDNYRIVIKQNNVVRYYLVFDYVTRSEYDDHYEKYYHFKCFYDSAMPSGITANYSSGKLQINEFRWLDIGIYYSFDSSKSYDYTDTFSFGFNYLPIYNIKTVNNTSLLGSGNLLISGELPSISTQYIRITDLDTGVYKLTYSGTKYIRYYGSTSTSNVAVDGSNVVLIVNKSSSYWNWYYVIPGSQYFNVHCGYTTSSFGNQGKFNFSNVITNLYRHNIIMAWTNFKILIIIINSQATAYTKTTLGQYLANTSGEIWVSGWDMSSNKPIYEFGGGTWGFEYWYLDEDDSYTVPSSAMLADYVNQA